MSKSQSICIFASEVAALTGRSPWKTPEQAIGEVLLRHGTDGSARKARHRAEAAHRHAVVDTMSNRVTRRLDLHSLKDEVRRATAAEDTEVREQARAELTRCDIGGDLAESLLDPREPVSTEALARCDVTARPVLRAWRERATENARRMVVEETSNELYQATVVGDKRKIDRLASELDIEGSDCHRQAQQDAAMSAGIIHEDAALERMEKATPARVLSGKQLALRRTLVTERGKRWTLYGKVDALDGEKIVETKQRQKRLFGHVPEYELPQILAYMYMARVPSAIQNEDFNGDRNEHHVEFDTMLWTDIMESLSAMIDRHFE